MATRAEREELARVKADKLKALNSFARAADMRAFYKDWLIELVGEEEVKRRTAEFESRPSPWL